MSNGGNLDRPFLDIGEQINGATSSRNAEGGGGSSTGAILPVGGSNTGAILPGDNKKKVVEKIVQDVWYTMTWFLVSESGILTAMYNIPNEAKCQYWWILLVLIIPISAVCLARLGVEFHLLYKEKLEGSEEVEDVALWLASSPWRIHALAVCAFGTICINTIFLCIGAKLIPCWLET